MQDITKCDFDVIAAHGLTFITPMTEEAHDWAGLNLDGVEQMTFGPSIVVELRYVADIVMGIQSDGLTVSGDWRNLSDRICSAG